MTMRVGLLLDNLDSPADSSFQKLANMQARVTGLLWTGGENSGGTKHRRPVYDRLEQLFNGRMQYIVRVDGYGNSPDGWLAAARAAVDEVPDAILIRGDVVLTCQNEPNLEQWPHDPIGYGRLYAEIKPQYSSVPILSACPSMGVDGWRQYLYTALAQGPKPTGIALNAYDYLIREVPAVIDAAGNAPCYITEVNTLRPARVPWLRDAFNQLAQAGVKAATVFIAGGRSNGDWDERYILSQDECEQLAGWEETMTEDPRIQQLLDQNALLTECWKAFRQGRFEGAAGIDGLIVALQGGAPLGFAPSYPPK